MNDITFVPGSFKEDLIVQLSRCCNSLNVQSVGVHGVFTIGLYDLKDTGMFMPLGLNSIVGESDYWTDGTHDYMALDTLPSWIHVSQFDTTSRHIVGTFAMTLKEVQPATDSVLHLTNGQFDLRFEWYP